MRRPVEPLVHSPEHVEAARVGGVGVVDDAIRERERTHARCLASVGWDVFPRTHERMQNRICKEFLRRVYVIR